MRKPLIALLLAVGLTAPAWAHDGHNHVHGHNPMGQAEDHHHDAPHGGKVRSVQQFHFELVTKPNRTAVYLLDANLKTLPVKGRKGEAIVQLDGQTKKVALKAEKDHFSAPLDLSQAGQYVAVVSLVIDGKTYRGRFVHPDKHH